jgi:hypothetical protein
MMSDKIRSAYEKTLDGRIANWYVRLK